MKRLLTLLLLLMPVLAYGQPTDLLISEYVEGSSNNKAIELYNGTGSAIDLTAGNYVLQMYFNGSAAAGLTISLNGTVAPGDVFLLAQSSAGAAILAQADQTNGSGWFNGDDAVVLRKGGAAGTIVDAIGQVGFDPGTEWGAGLASTADNTLRRKAGACTGDVNVTDAFDPSVSFDGFAIDLFDGLGSHVATCGGGDLVPSVAGTSPASGAGGIAPDASIVITFSENVAVSGSWFTIERQGGGTVAAAVSGGGAEYTLDPTADLQEGGIYTVTVHAAGVSDVDADDPPDQMVSDYSFSFTVQSVVKISTIQGSGSTSPMVGQSVTIEGIVAGDFQKGDGDLSDLDGFYLQEEPADDDGNAATSEGIFVFAPGGVNVNPGDIVRVTGRVTEFVTSGGSSLTEIGGVGAIAIRGTAPLPPPVDITLPVASIGELERYEGMLVRFPQDLVIAEYFDFDRFNEIVLAEPLDDLSRPFTPTSYVEPGAASAAVAQAIALRRITLDDGRTSQNPDPARHPDGGIFTLANSFRGGDLLRNTTGILDDRFGLYRVQPTQGADYVARNPRTAHPEDVGGCLKVSSFNVLNYFLTIDNAGSICGPGENQECRGADTREEFTRQRSKILSALAAIDADVFGLIELENTAGVEPLQDIVAGLNALAGAGTYSYIATGTIGTDAIKVGIVYKPGSVTPVGGHAILTSAVDPGFIDTKNRPSLAQTFRENATGSAFTVVVNHLKSKGSDCNDVGDPDLGDGQGNCNETRTMAARALVDWLAADPTGSGDPDYLIIGDLNSYDKEDPIDAITAGSDDLPGTGDDFVDLIARHKGEFAYSYVFDGQAGYLDHALASSSLARQVTGATEWHINADEPDILDYDMTFKQAAQDSLYEPSPYRASDHDPVVVGLDIAPPAITVAARPAELWSPNHKYHTVSLNDLGLVARDACDAGVTSADVVIAEAWSDEVENGPDDGNTVGDIVIAADCRSVDLRAERQEGGNGRVYTLKLQVADALGSVGTAYYQVKVPVGRRGESVDDGSAYAVSGCTPGVFMRAVAPGGDVSADAELASDMLRSYPGAVNPATIEFDLAVASDVRLALYDAAGEEVTRLMEGPADAGTHRVRFASAGLPSGSYFCRLTVGGDLFTRRIVVVK